MTKQRGEIRSNLRKDKSVTKRFRNSLINMDSYYKELVNKEQEYLLAEVTNKNKSQNYRACVQLILNEREAKK